MRRVRISSGIAFASVLAVAGVVSACSGAAATSPASASNVASDSSSPTVRTPGASTAAATGQSVVEESPTSDGNAAPTPAVKPSSSPPAAGAPWGGLTFTAVTPVQPQPTVTERTSFRGGTFGVVETPAEDGKVRLSIVRGAPDETWAEVFATTIEQYSALLAASDTTIVAVADGGSWASADGTTWTPGNLPGASGLSVGYVTFGPAGFVAGTSTRSPAFWKSTDGKSWRKLSTATTAFQGAEIDRVTGVPGGYVMTGGTGRVDAGPGYMGPRGGRVAVWRSKDAEHWTRSTVQEPKGGAEMLGRVYAVDAGLFADGWLYTDGDNGNGYVSAAWTSADGGKSWKYHATDTRAQAARSTFVPEIPVPRWHLLGTDGHRLLSIAFGDTTPATAICESFDGSSWHQLRIEGLDYLNHVVGSEWLLAQIRLDTVGITIDFGGNAAIRGWATP